MKNTARGRGSGSCDIELLNSSMSDSLQMQSLGCTLAANYNNKDDPRTSSNEKHQHL